MNVIKCRPCMVLVTLVITLIAYPAMATDVGGIIDTDTTWDLAGSPYYITSELQIAEGVTLSIDPDVVIEGQNMEIRVWGTLQAVGTSNFPIWFNYVTIGPGPTATAAIINIQYSQINLGRVYYANYGGYGSLILRNSRIQNTEDSFIGGRHSDCYIEQNVFTNSGGLDISGPAPIGTHVYIRNNVFHEQRGGYAVENIWSSENSQTIVEYNSFLSTDRIALRLGKNYPNAAMIGTNNYWNTLDSNVIETMIYDKNDDITCAGYIEYEPFLTERDQDTPILYFNQAPTSNSGDDQVVHNEVTLNGTGSSDPDGSLVSYDWPLQHRTNSENDKDSSGVNPTVYNLNPGFYDVYLTVTDDGGLVDVDNMLLAVAGSCFCSPSTVHIEKIRPGLLKTDKGKKHGKALVKVMDDCGNAVSGVTVYGSFSGDLSESVSGETGGHGKVLLTTTTSTKRKPSFTFCVDDVINGTLSYAPADNVENCDSY